MIENHYVALGERGARVLRLCFYICSAVTYSKHMLLKGDSAETLVAARVLYSG